MEGCFTLQWGWGGGAPWGGMGFDEGGRVLKKIVGWEVFPYAPPTVGNPVKTEVFFQYRCNCVHQL